MTTLPVPLASDEVTALRTALLKWGKTHFRPFPWRQTTDPYRILVAEILLHRTQVKQVVPVYEAFISRYPDFASLAQANRDDLHQALYSLGLRWRVDLLYEMVQEIFRHCKGEIPRARNDLLALPGVSQYMAGAVRCFAWNEPEVLMDTNTVRIVGRLLGWEVKDSSRRSKRFRQALELLLDPQQPRAFNYALLDLAHLVCLKRQPPLCAECPLQSWCVFALKGGNAHVPSQ
ncbi:DNA-binding protein [Candidatus Parcubacteria bacterium]|nr:MAG: DNA-binding protein [Candidatus Parcubacteria bacterium]